VRDWWWWSGVAREDGGAAAKRESPPTFQSRAVRGNRRSAKRKNETSPLTLSLSPSLSLTPTQPNNRTKQELSHPGNEGLADVVEWLKPIAEAAAPKLSLADVIQLAAVVVVECAGGPVLGFEPGRRDSWAYAPEGRLFDPRKAAREASNGAAAAASTSGSAGGAAAAGPSSSVRRSNSGGLTSSSSPSSSPVSTAQAQALRAFAARLGMPLRHVVALAGIHSLGRWWPDTAAAASAATEAAGGTSEKGPPLLPLITAPPPGAEGSPRFDNSYFTKLLDGSLPSDAFLLADAETRLLVEEYAASEATFFVDYAAAHDELSRLGMPRGSGNWHRQHQQEQHQKQQQQQEQEQNQENNGFHGKHLHGHKKHGGSGKKERPAGMEQSPPQSAFDMARLGVRGGGNRRSGAPRPPPPPSYWSSWPAIDNLAKVMGVSPGTAAAASAAVGAVAVLGGAALVWSRRRRPLLWRR